jgi:7,8-dihydroneopterin 2',3'-cyclic phosphate phosphodiesterase
VTTNLDRRLKRLVDRIENKFLRKKTIKFLENLTVRIEDKTYSGLSLDASPAGLSRHHSYPGGFVEHTVATTEIALNLCDIVEKVYGGKVERDFVLAGAILHDAFKPLTYEVRDDGSYATNSLGTYLDHINLAISEMIRNGFPLEVVHIVAAHHGGEAGPVWPRTVEALICHLADLADSRLNGEVLRAAHYLSREATGVDLVLHNSKDAYEIVNAKVSKGWDGVRDAVKKIEKKKLRKNV